MHCHNFLFLIIDLLLVKLLYACLCRQKQCKKIAKTKMDIKVALAFYVKILLENRDGRKKKKYRCTPTFVNLKSNTMKTLQMYGLFDICKSVGA